MLIPTEKKMKTRILFPIFMLLLALLPGCSQDAPSNNEIKEIVYGVYFVDASILEKAACEINASMAAEGHSNVWLVRFLQENSDMPNSFVITESPEGVWNLFTGSYIKGQCPGN